MLCAPMSALFVQPSLGLSNNAAFNGAVSGARARVYVRANERGGERESAAAAPLPPQAWSPHRAAFLMERFHSLTNVSAGVTALFG